MNYRFLVISLFCFMGGFYAVWKSVIVADSIRWSLLIPGLLLIFWGALYGKNMKK